MADDDNPKAEIGVTGLAVMGANLARNLAHHGFRTAVHNRTDAKTDDLIEHHGHEGAFVPSHSPEDFVASLARPRVIVSMVKAGAGTDAVIDTLSPLLDEGDVLVDGGNALFTDTERRERHLADRGIHFVGMGVSGGEEGALNGPSIMPGGSDHAWDVLRPKLEAIAAEVDGTPCTTHVGPGGAGHFVKMVHNGIEYADMQLIAESYELLRSGLGQSPAQIAEIFRQWNEGDLESFLIETTATVLDHVDAATGRPFIDIVVDEAEQKGTGRWTVQAALDLGVPVTGIAEAVFARVVSSEGELRRTASAKLAGPSGQLSGPVRETFVDDVRQALYASKVVAYAQGFAELGAASVEHGWNVDLGSMATIWRGGCIIRARFLNRIKDAYDSAGGSEGLPSLLLDDYFAEVVGNAQDAWRRVVAAAAVTGVPTPGFASALAYYDGLRRERGSAALIQGLRDFFGAHTYARVDRPGTFHTLWGQEGRREIDSRELSA